MNLRTLEPTEIHMGSPSEAFLHIIIQKNKPGVWKLQGEISTITCYDSIFGWSWFKGEPFEFSRANNKEWSGCWRTEPGETRFLLKFYADPKEIHAAVFLNGEELPKKLLADHHTYSNERMAKVKEEHPFLLPPDEKPKSVNFLDSSYRTLGSGDIHKAAKEGPIMLPLDNINRWQ